MTGLRLVLATTLAVLFVSASTHADVEVAVVGPMSGEYAMFGEQMRRGAKLAVDDINAGGGVLDEEVELIIGDDQCDPIKAVEIANRLPTDGVMFVAGHLCSAASVHASRIYAEEGIIQISPASTDPKLTDEGGDNVFRVSGRQDQQAVIAGNFLARAFGSKKIAIVHNDSLHGRKLAVTISKILNEAGIREAYFEPYDPAANDYSELMAALKRLGVEVFYVAGHHSESALMIKQAHEIGYRPQLVSSDTLTAVEFWQMSGGAGEGAIMSSPPDPRLNPAAAPVVSRFRAQKFEPKGYTLTTYAAVQVWAQAIRKAGSSEPQKVIEILKSNRFKTILGEISFDAKGDVSLPSYVWYRWSNGTFAPL